MYISKSPITVRYVETDRMGVVHHSNYACYFEVGRTNFINEMGISYADIEKEGVMMPLTHLDCRFHEGARYGDELIVETRCTMLSIARCTFVYDVLRRADGAKLCEGSTTHAFVGADDFKPLNLKKRFPHIYHKMEESLSPASGQSFCM